MIPDTLLMDEENYSLFKCRQFGVQVIIWAENEPMHTAVEQTHYTAYYESTGSCYEVHDNLILFQYILMKVVFYDE